MEIGKLKNDVLEDIVLGEIKSVRDDILIRPSVGEDCAAIAFGDMACVLTTDPITGAASNLGKLAVHICVNDIASSGSEPVALMLTLLCPEGTKAEAIGNILKEANETANALGIDIIGGHTEITSAVNRTIVSATAIGKTLIADLIKTGGGQPGDLIYLSKHPGLEGTAIIAHDLEAQLKEALPNKLIEKAKSHMDSISVLKEGKIGAIVGVNAMHDATEGGVLGAIHELCEASGTGCRVFHQKFEILEETAVICDFLNIDPLKLISSGVMVFAVAPEKASDFEIAFVSEGIPYSKVGVLTEENDKILVYGMDPFSEIVEKIEMPEADELYKVI